MILHIERWGMLCLMIVSTVTARPRHADGEPCEGDLCTHIENGVEDDHAADDSMGKEKDNELLNEAAQDFADIYHGILMHGDSELGIKHHHKETDEKDGSEEKARLLNMDELRHAALLHGNVNEDSDHDISSHQSKSPKPLNKNVLDIDRIRHNLMIHGDLDADLDHDLEKHSEKDVEHEDHNKLIGLDIDKIRHALIGHGSLDADIDHAMDEGAYNNRRHPKDVRIGPDFSDPILRTDGMKGETLLVNRARQEGTVDRDILLLMVRRRLKDLDLSKISPEEVDEFIRWLAEDTENEDALDNSFSVISDTLREDIKEMKRRYLKMYYEHLKSSSDENEENESEEGDSHSEDDILDVVDIDESDEDYNTFVEKVKTEESHTGLK